MSDLLFTRCAIFDASLRVDGYMVEYAPLGISGKQSTNPAAELLGALVDIGIHELAEQHKLYIVCSPRDAEPLIELCSASHQLGLYLEYSRDLHKEALDIVRLSSTRSVSIALGTDCPDATPAELLVNADVAFLHNDWISDEVIANWCSRLRGYRARAGVGNIVSHKQFQAARDTGCERFHGTFLEAPTRWMGREIPGGVLSPLKLLAKLQDPDTTMDEIEQLVRTDAALSYRVLRWVNSAYYGIGIEIDHIGHAIVYLGLTRLKDLLSLLALAQLRPVSQELLTMSAIRARMAELLAPRFGVKPFRAFTLGLFSLVDAIAQAPLEDVLATVSLNNDIATALLTGDGPYGQLLQVVLNYEKGNWKAVQLVEEPEKLADIYRDAIHWASSHGLANENAA